MTVRRDATAAKRQDHGIDAILVLSFGGPEGPDDVLPFLRNVTRGRGIPDERLEVVGEHYAHFGGVSPLNDQNRQIVADLQQALAQRGMDVPVYFGNRNWHPFVEDTAAQMAADGIRRALVFATSAWAGFSGCRQYHEDIARIREHLASHNLPAIEFHKLRHFFDHPLFIEAAASCVAPLVDAHPTARVVFTAHSIPLSANHNSGLSDDGALYERQVREASRLVATRCGVEDYDVVWQSRSGAPHVPWLEPDIVDHMADCADRGVTEMIVVPVGFVSDHIEVIWDLDTELVQAAAERGVTIHRAASVGHNPTFIDMIVDLVNEELRNDEHERLGDVPSYGCGTNGQACATNCCPSARPGHGARPHGSKRGAHKPEAQKPGTHAHGDNPGHCGGGQ